MRWLSFPDWPHTQDRRIFATEWSWEPEKLARSKRFFAAFEDRGKYKVLSVLVYQCVSLDELPLEHSTRVQESNYEPRMESESKAHERLVQWCDFLQKGSL